MKNVIFVNFINFETNDRGIPNGILSLATVLRKSYNASVIDFSVLWDKGIIRRSESFEKNLNIMSDYLINLEPDIIAFYSLCNSYHISIMLAKRIREIKASIKIIFGGPQASLTAQTSLEAFSWIDAIGIGEGEKNIELLVETLVNERDLGKVPGIAFRNNGSVKINEEVELIQDLDELPYTDFDLIDINNYQSITIEAGRGCPYICSFCSSKTFWKRKYRIKSSKRLIREIKNIHYKYKKTDFTLVHDIFTLNKQNVIEFCNEIILEGIKIRWYCSGRVDTLDEEMIVKMKQAGCKGIFLGIETGSARMQKLINKNINLNNVWTIVKLLKKYNLKITMAFMYGFPNETFDDLRDTLKMFQKAVVEGVEVVQLNAWVPLAKTELFEANKEKMVICKFSTGLTGNNIYLYNKEVQNIIESHIDIFPQYFMINNETRSKVHFLDIFIIRIYFLFNKSFTNTYKFIIDYYNNDLLSFFIEFRRINPDFFNKVGGYFGKQDKSSILSVIHLLDKFVNELEFGNMTEKIKNTFKYESDMLKLALVLKRSKAF